MTKAIRFHEYGGPEVLKYETVEVGQPGPGEIRLKQTAIGLNFIDVYHRTGLYPQASLPSGIGLEAAGIIEAVGPGVKDFHVGDRVAYGTGPVGSYAEHRLIPANKVILIPERISDNQAASMMLQGMTTEYLIRRTYCVQAGDTVLLHAAAGGVGSIASQWLNHLGATVIGTVGSEEKADIARSKGCHHTINYKTENFVERVKEITAGKGVNVVYDSVGKDTFMGSLDCLKVRGTMVTFGNASGPVPPIEPLILNQKGGLYLTRPSLAHYTGTHSDLVASAKALFSVVSSGVVKIDINQSYPLSEAGKAHQDLEARKTTGSTIMIPQH
ncbi:quinone oxidoreductase family protein [Kiloniella laminariae]|uniref:quinone oxidoreductase family protein n=1 Tax=Kiloniella laminariae TaxID=454162 RepID=UPI00036A8EB2|nr:quinone oxidoreductase [Kiloniella laminariae]